MSLEDLPEAFGDFFGISETAGGLILSIIVILAIVLPVLILARNVQNAPTIVLIFVFFAECVVLSLNWLPFWIMIMTIAITALGLSQKLSGAIAGG